MSSSDESEDDEMSKKISAAICDESIIQNLATAQTAAAAAGTQTSQQNQSQSRSVGSVDHSDLASSRESCATKKSQLPNKVHTRSIRHQDNNADQGCENVLNTTPGFRAHVSKQLSIMLDKKLKDLLSENIWKCSKQSKTIPKGIQLFSNSTMRCCSPESADIVKSDLDTSKAEKRKKHPISSSSDSSSSEDDKIKACVFSQEDILKENERLSKLQKSTKNPEITPDESEDKTNAESIPMDIEIHKKCKNAKKKRKKDKNIDISH
uniref:Protein CUSTOS n=1 Tax=Biomphalaria glabrata TaxID=6526 RepID=A0A2C9L4U0_BIOGL